MRTSSNVTILNDGLDYPVYFLAPPLSNSFRKFSLSIILKHKDIYIFEDIFIFNFYL